MFNEEIKKQLTEILSGMQNEVTVTFFSKANCPDCDTAKEFIEELASLNSKIILKQELTDALAPSFKLSSEAFQDSEIIFNGIPGGHEINSFLQTLLMLSGVDEELPKDISDRIKAIDKDIDIKVFVTLSCPHCPGAVVKAHRLAMENPRIKSQMIEAQTFMELSNEYRVSSVPKIVINGKDFVGNQPLEVFLETMEAIN